MQEEHFRFALFPPVWLNILLREHRHAPFFQQRPQKGSRPPWESKGCAPCGLGATPTSQAWSPQKDWMLLPTPTYLGQDPPGSVSLWGPQAGAQKVAGLRTRRVLHPRPDSPCAGCAFRAVGFSADMQVFGY